MLKIAVYIILAYLGCELVTADNLKCYPNRTIHFTNPDSSIYTHYTAFYEADNGTTLGCISSADPTKDNIYFDCHSTTTTMTAFFSDRDFAVDGILGGNTTVHTFQCTSIVTYNATLSDDLTVSLSQTDETSDPVYNITAKFYDGFNNPVTEAHVGDTVYFVITGPTEYALKPLECNATGGVDEYETIITDGCTEDGSLVSSFVTASGTLETNYTTTVYVFKFYTSDSLAVICNVKVCVGAGCNFSCSGRKRRALSGDTSDGDVKTSRIGNRLRIIEKALGGSGQSKGSVVLIIGLMVNIALLCDWNIAIELGTSL